MLSTCMQPGAAHKGLVEQPLSSRTSTCDAGAVPVRPPPLPPWPISRRSPSPANVPPFSSSSWFGSSTAALIRSRSAVSHASTSAWVVRAPHRPHCQSAPSSQTGLPSSSPYGSAVQRSQPAGHDAHRRKPPHRSFSVGSVQRAHAHVKHLVRRSSRCRMYLMRERSSALISGHHCPSIRNPHAVQPDATQAQSRHDPGAIQAPSRRHPGAIQAPSKHHRASTYVGSSVAT